MDRYSATSHLNNPRTPRKLCTFGKVTAADVVTLKSAKTVNGKSLKLATHNGGVRVDSANLVKTDILCTNGVIHVIDSVVLPQ